MRRLPALLLACALLVIVCVPTTHAMQNDPGKPQAHIVFQPESPVVADEGGWIETKSSLTHSYMLDTVQRLIRAYFHAFLTSPAYRNHESEAMPSYDSRQPSPIESSRSAR